MRLWNRFAVPVVLFLCLVLLVQGSACAQVSGRQFTDKSGDLPGIDHHVGLELGLVGAGGAALVGYLVYRHRHMKSKIVSGPVEMPSSISFDRSEKEQALSIVNTSPIPLNVSEIVAGSGFSLVGRVQFPALLRTGEQLNVSISRAAPFKAKRGRVSVTMVDSDGKTVNRIVTIHAARLNRAQ